MTKIRIRDAVEEDLPEVRQLIRDTMMEDHQIGFESCILRSWKIQAIFILASCLVSSKVDKSVSSMFCSYLSILCVTWFQNRKEWKDRVLETTAELEDWKSFLQTYQADRNHFFLVAAAAAEDEDYEEDIIIGCIGLSQPQGLTEFVLREATDLVQAEAVEIKRACVAFEYRQMGIARELMERAEKRLEERAMEEDEKHADVVFTTTQMNRPTMYDKLNFHLICQPTISFLFGLGSASIFVFAKRLRFY